MHKAIFQQLGGAIDALDGVIQAFPDASWTAGEKWHQPWYLAFHTLFWLDLYLSESSSAYQPPAPFTRSELAPDAFPEQIYSKEQLLAFSKHCRQSLLERMSTVADEAGLRRRCRLHWGEMDAGELLLYNLRHVQHHVGQLNALIRRAGAEPAPWVMRADGLEHASTDDER